MSQQKLKVERVEIDSVTPDPANTRLHPDRNIDAIRGSLRRFGQQKPIVVDMRGVVRAGNGTLLAAKAENWTHIEIVRTDLEDIEAIAYSIADNKTSDLAEWDYQALADNLRSLKDTDEQLLISTGFADHEVDPLLQAVWNPPDITMMDDAASNSSRNLTFNGEQWELIQSAIDAYRDTVDTDVSESEAIAQVCKQFVS